MHGLVYRSVPSSVLWEDLKAKEHIQHQDLALISLSRKPEPVKKWLILGLMGSNQDEPRASGSARK